MLKVAVIGDNIPTSKQLMAWIESACTTIKVGCNRDDAEAGLVRERYDLLVLDIERAFIMGSL